MPMSTYLSIDIDFWKKQRDLVHMKKFLEIAKGASPNILIVDSHEQLKSHVNKSGCNTLINVDYHSDIYDIAHPHYDHTHDPYERKYNCGTWVNFVNCRNKGSFTWIHPHIHDRGIQYGYCHVESRRNFMTVNPFFNPKIAEWNETYKIASLTPEDHINWNDVVAVGIAFSYAWLRHGTKDGIVHVAREVLGKKPKVNPNAILN